MACSIRLLAIITLILSITVLPLVSAQVQFSNHWFITLDKPDYQYLGNIACDDNRYLYVVGENISLEENGLIAKIDLSRIDQPSQSLAWMKEYDVTDYIRNVLYKEENGEGYLYVVGETSYFSWWGSDAFVAKIKASDGSVVWFTVIGENDWMDESAAQIVYAGDTGKLYVIGDVSTFFTWRTGYDVLIARVDPSTSSVEKIWRLYTGGDDYEEFQTEDHVRKIFYDESEHALYITGHTNIHSDQNRWDDDVFAAKIDFSDPNNPKVVWYKQFGSSNSDGANSLMITGDYVYVAGKYNDDDVFVAKLSKSDGSIVWSTVFGGDDTDEAFDLIYAGNELWVTGSTDSWGAGYDDAFIAEINPSTGYVVKLYTIGGGSSDKSEALTTISAQNGLFLCTAGVTGYGPNAWNIFVTLFSPSIGSELVWTGGENWGNVHVSTPAVTSILLSPEYENIQPSIEDASTSINWFTYTSSVQASDVTSSTQVHLAEDNNNPSSLEDQQSTGSNQRSGLASFSLGGTLCSLSMRMWFIMFVAAMIVLLSYTLYALKRR